VVTGCIPSEMAKIKTIRPGDMALADADVGAWGEATSGVKTRILVRLADKLASSCMAQQ